MAGGFSLIANSAISWKPLLRFLLRNSGLHKERGVFERILPLSIETANGTYGKDPIYHYDDHGH